VERPGGRFRPHQEITGRVKIVEVVIAGSGIDPQDECKGIVGELASGRYGLLEDQRLAISLRGPVIVVPGVEQDAFLQVAKEDQRVTAGKSL
jgi:hypothetical protein